jgi:uncharacterized Zn finger protein
VTLQYGKQYIAHYVSADCSGCGRRRLELVVDVSSDRDGGMVEKAVAVRCEKCGRTWRLSEKRAMFTLRSELLEIVDNTYGL